MSGGDYRGQLAHQDRQGAPVWHTLGLRGLSGLVGLIGLIGLVGLVASPTQRAAGLTSETMPI